MKKYLKLKMIFLSLLGGILLSISWPANGFAYLLFIAFIPFLIVENEIYINEDKFSKFSVFLYTYSGFLLWNILTTWWIYYSSIAGALMAIVFNALFMALIFQFFHYCKKRLYKSDINRYEIKGYFMLIVFWISFEYFHLNWDLSWPWLTLGNGFASDVKIIQWYEYTGVFGGSLWILIVNVLIFNFINLLLQKSSTKKIVYNTLLLLFLIFIPIFLSLRIYTNYEEKINPVDIVVAQPNIDPYGEKFDSRYTEQIWEKILGQTVEKIDKNVDFILWPETSIPSSILINDIGNIYSINRIKDSLIKYSPNSILISGADVYQIYDTKKTETARYFKDGQCCWDSYNSAIEMDTSGILNIYHKSKLVPGVEKMPYPQIFGFLENYAIDLGGTTGSLGKSPFLLHFPKVKFLLLLLFVMSQFMVNF